MRMVSHINLTTQSMEFKLRTCQFCVLHAFPLCQRPHMKNKKNNTQKTSTFLWFTRLKPISL